jgi:hypothetical protein
MERDCGFPDALLRYRGAGRSTSSPACSTLEPDNLTFLICFIPVFENTFQPLDLPWVIHADKLSQGPLGDY